jgi:hypothetical protein
VNEIEQNEFEAELRKIKPARAPDELLKRLALAHPDARCRRPAAPRRSEGFAAWTIFLRFAGAGTAAAVAVFIAWRSGTGSGPAAVQPAPAASGSLKADGVEVDQHLVSSFDTVAQLPGGEPIRFHVQRWMDHVKLNDKDRGVVIDHSNPRVEVVTVGFETY